MSPRSSLTTALALALIPLAACVQDTTPTQPSVTTEVPSLAVASNTWIKRGSMPLGRHSMDVGVVPNALGQPVLYVIAGQTGFHVTDLVQAYDYATNKWTTKAPLPTRLVLSNGVGVIDGKIYISGGILDPDRDDPPFLRSLFVYDPARDKWTRKADLPHLLAQGITGVIGGKLYVLTGGCQDCPEGIPVRRLLRYDPSTDKWTTRRQSPHYHAGGVGGVIGGKFYAAGGVDNTGTASTQLDVYDPATNRWTTKAAMPTVRASYAGAVLDGKLYIVGGAQAGPVGLVEAYDPKTNKWTTKSPMPTPRQALAAAGITFNGNPKLLAVGGVSGDDINDLSVNEAYKP